MDRLTTRVHRVDPDYQNHRTHNLELIETLRSRLDAVSEGGGGKYVERHRSRGKMLAREGFRKSSTQVQHSSNYLLSLHLNCMTVERIVQELLPALV